MRESVRGEEEFKRRKKRKATLGAANKDNMPPRLNLFTSSRNAAVSLRRLHLQSTASPSLSSSSSSSICTASSSRARSSLSLLNTQRHQHQRRAVSSTSGSGDGTGATKGKGVEGDVVGPNQDPLPDVGQEAAEIDRIVNKGGEHGGEMGSCGKGSPEFEQGTPVQEVCCRFIYLFSSSYL